MQIKVVPNPTSYPTPVGVTAQFDVIQVFYDFKILYFLYIFKNIHSANISSWTFSIGTGFR